MTSASSVIVLAVGPDRLVARIAASLAAQSISDLEVVVVHHGDEPAVRRRVGPITTTFETRFVRAQATAPGAIRNLGVRASRGGAFVVLDGSEEPQPEFLSAVRSALDRAPQAGFATSLVASSSPPSSGRAGTAALPRLPRGAGGPLGSSSGRDDPSRAVRPPPRVRRAAGGFRRMGFHADRGRAGSCRHRGAGAVARPPLDRRRRAA